jgi:enediyne biosynthesis protein E4
VDFVNTIVETDTLHVMNFEYIYNGGGVGAVDLNNDGLTDLIFTGNQVAPKIYLNNGNFSFQDISASFAGT